MKLKKSLEIIEECVQFVYYQFRKIMVKMNNSQAIHVLFVNTFSLIWTLTISTNLIIRSGQKHYPIIPDFLVNKIIKNMEMI
jgi:hypothetical protein